MWTSVLSLPATARAQGVAVYVSPAPPPPPPPSPRYVITTQPEDAYALALAADIEGSIPVNTPQFLNGNTLQGGGGIKLRAGERIRLAPALHLTPELGLGYTHLFATDDIGNAYAWDMQRVLAGARLDFGRVLVPVLYGHVGVGWRATGDPSVPQTSGFAYDLGVALDLRLLSYLGLGAHWEYAGVDAEPYTPQWTTFGLHAELDF